MDMFDIFQEPPNQESPTMRAVRAGARGGMPTAEQIKDAEANLQYRRDRIHIAVCSSTGSERQRRCLLNAFLGLNFGNPLDGGGTTAGIVRYTVTRAVPYKLFVWYDVPVPSAIDEEYFGNLGIFIFDAIVLVYGAVSCQGHFSLLMALTACLAGFHRCRRQYSRGWPQVWHSRVHRPLHGHAQHSGHAQFYQRLDVFGRAGLL
jgi:hypothetical protein